MKKKTARRWLTRNKLRLFRDGMNKKDKKQVVLCLKTLNIREKLKTE